MGNQLYSGISHEVLSLPSFLLRYASKLPSLL